MNLTNLRAMGRLLVPRADTTVISDANQLIIFNQGVIDICLKTKCLIKEGSFDTVADQQDYSLNTEFSDFLCPLDEGCIFYYDGTDYDELDIVNIGYLNDKYEGWKSESSGTPERAYILGDKLYLHPKPDTAVTNGINMSYVYKPTEMDTSSNVYPFGGSTEIPRLSSYSMVVVDYYIWMANRVLYALEKPELVEQSRQQYLNNVSLMANDMKIYKNDFLSRSREAKFTTYDYKPRF